MRSTLLTLVTAWIVAVPAVAQSAPAGDSATSSLMGHVSGSFDGEASPLPYAVIEATGDGFGGATVADSLGRYEISGLPAGEVRLRATHAGHAPLTLTVYLTPNGSTTVDLVLRADPVRLPPIEVLGDAERATSSASRDEPDAVVAEVELQSLDLAPGVGQPGLLAAVRALPGNDPADATDVLFMRGSTTDLKLVLLDGVPVYTPFHVAGLMRSFDPTVLGRADLHVGGAPARYDGGLTHILDLGTRKARRDRARASGSVDLMSASAAAETPLGESAGLVLSARSLHDLGQATLGGPGPYGYRDLLASFDAEPAPGHAVRATGFWNAESVRLDFDRVPGDAEWSNRAGSLGYEVQLGGTRLDFTAGASGYLADLPLQPSGEPNQPPPPTLFATAAIDRVRIVGEALWGSAEAPLRAGLAFDRIDASFAARGGSGSSSSEASTSTPGAFVDVIRPLGPGLTLRAGVRGDLFDLRNARFAPRAALLWDVGPEALLTIAAGRYHQASRTPDFEVERTLAEVADEGIDPSALLPVATADHVVLSLDQRLAGRVSLGLEGFWKRFEGLAESRGETVRSSGIDVRVVSTGDAGVAWLGYGLSWFWSTLDLSGQASDFAGRHLLSAGVSGELLGPLRGEARLAYGGGLPYSSIPFRGQSLDAAAEPAPGSESLAPPPPPIVQGLDEEFLRIDLELHALWEPEWGGRPWQVRPYVRVINALNRRDALFYTFQPWRSESVTPLAERSLLPLFGVAFSF